MSNYVSPAEAAKMVRTALKAIGLGQKQVSVTSDSFSGGSALRVRVKDTSIGLDKVKAIAEGQERIDRCEYSGEILSGCNRYVTVEYDRDALKLAAAPLVAQLPTIDNMCNKVGGFNVVKSGSYFTIFTEARSMQCWGAEHTAEQIVTLIANGAQSRELA